MLESLVVAVYLQIYNPESPLQQSNTKAIFPAVFYASVAAKLRIDDMFKYLLNVPRLQP